MELHEQRRDIESAIMYFDKQIKDATYKRQVLTNAFNSIDQNKENILESETILAEETRRIMYEINKNINL